MKIKKYLSIIFLMISISLSSVEALAHKCDSPLCDSGIIRIKPSTTIQPTLECVGSYPYIRSWDYTRSDKIVLCSLLSFREHKILLTCRNFNTKWGSAHNLNFTWKCLKEKPPIPWNPQPPA